MSSNRRRFLKLLGVGGVGSIAGCSGSSETDDGTAGQPPTPTATPAATVTPTTPPGTPSGGPPDEETELTKLDSVSGDVAAAVVSVALSGDGTTALLGTVAEESPNGDRAGSAYVFAQSGGSWTQQARLTAADGDSEDRFGDAVALSGDGATAVAGASVEEDPNGEGAGAAYVFSQSGGSWAQRAKLTPDDGDRSDAFGDAVAMPNDGGAVLVGAPYDGSLGSAYVFTRSGGSWVRETKLADESGDGDAAFGKALALSDDGTTALVGAPQDGEYAGSASVVSRSGGSWTRETKLVASDGDVVDFFGESVALSHGGDTAFVGAFQDSNSNGEMAGSAYVFTRSGGSWTQEGKLTAADGDEDDGFGDAVALSGDGATGLVGAPDDEDPNGEDSGSAYVFGRSSGSWTQRLKLAPDDGYDGDVFFGRSAALSDDGTTALVAPFRRTDANSDGAGAACVFDL